MIEFINTFIFLTYLIQGCEIMQLSYKNTAYHVSIITMFMNLILSLFKLIAGLYGYSHAMISDAVHSMSDCASTIIVMIGIHFSSMDADKEHPYGHERMECIASMLLAVLLVFTGLQIGYQSLVSLISPHTIMMPSFLALFAALISIIVKEGMYIYTCYYAKKIHSSSLLADAYHHQSDALSSIGSLIGIAGAMLGIKILDPLAGLCICVFILKPGISIFYDASIKMVDHSCSLELKQEMCYCIYNIHDVLSIDNIKTRLFNEKIYIDLEIGVNAELSLREAHDIAHNVHDLLEATFPQIKHCMIHVNPKDKKG